MLCADIVWTFYINIIITEFLGKWRSLYHFVLNDIIILGRKTLLLEMFSSVFFTFERSHTVWLHIQQTSWETLCFYFYTFWTHQQYSCEYLQYVCQNSAGGLTPEEETFSLEHTGHHYHHDSDEDMTPHVQRWQLLMLPLPLML